MMKRRITTTHNKMNRSHRKCLNISLLEHFFPLAIRFHTSFIRTRADIISKIKQKIYRIQIHNNRVCNVTIALTICNNSTQTRYLYPSQTKQKTKSITNKQHIKNYIYLSMNVSKMLYSAICH